jgi:hypothetical protein
MDIQKEKRDYLAMLVAEDAITQEQCGNLSLYNGGNYFHSDSLASPTVDCINWGWQGWLKAKAHAVSEGFVLVQKLLSDELADALASDAFNNIQSMFDYEHRDSPALQREQFRLRWCKNKARELQENYKMLIEAQEQGDDT